MDEKRFRHFVERMVMNGLVQDMLDAEQKHGHKLTKQELDDVILELTGLLAGEPRMGWDKRTDGELRAQLELAHARLSRGFSEEEEAFFRGQ